LRAQISLAACIEAHCGAIQVLIQAHCAGMCVQLDLLKTHIHHHYSGSLKQFNPTARQTPSAFQLTWKHRSS